MNKETITAILCLIFGGMLLGVSTNVAKYASVIGLAPLAFVFCPSLALL